MEAFWECVRDKGKDLPHYIPFCRATFWFFSLTNPHPLEPVFGLQVIGGELNIYTKGAGDPLHRTGDHDLPEFLRVPLLFHLDIPCQDGGNFPLHECPRYIRTH